MGSVLFAKMSQGGIGEPSSQKLHPFFVKGSSSDDAGPSSQSCPSDIRAPLSDTSNTNHLFELHNHHWTGVSNAQGLAAPTDVGPSPQADNISANFAQSIPATTAIERANLKATIENHQVQCPSNSHAVSNRVVAEADAKSAPIAQTTPTPSDPNNPLPLGRKILKLNARTGTLGSPPKTKEKKKPSFVICIKYGKDDESRRDIGDKISRILSGTLQPLKPQTRPRTNRKQARHGDGAVNTSATAKAAHPFFSEKTKSRSSTPAKPSDQEAKSASARKNSVFMSTPVSPRKQRNPFLPTSLNKAPYIGHRSLGVKEPGAKHPLWPARDMCHVRGDDCLALSRENKTKENGYRKSKGNATSIEPGESVLQALVDRLDVRTLLGNLPQNDDIFTPAPAELRLPQKHCESGQKLQYRIRSQLSMTSPFALAGEVDPNQDELAGPAPAMAHPAIRRQYLSLMSQLSAFDRSTCDSVAWCQKYAPVSAVEVLQQSHDAMHIKNWLEAMKVQSVDTGVNDSAADRAKSKSETAPKRKRKKNKTDDFIVDTDEEGSELEEISGDDDTNLDFRHSKKSVMRSGNLRLKDPSRLRNTVVISGPHGCGKTAAVYAIARELDFEVFEINSSSRRSGKDVLEKIGDMTRNHLVQQHRAQKPTMEAALADAGTGKQGMMTSFFKAKGATGNKPKQPHGVNQAKKAVSKLQKQSLILIEEADILYEEDKQFWTTLLGLMSQTRRPFVITCNDESLVPFQNLNLHGVFRFSPAPIPHAVDLCLLIAANEGHVVKRSAVESLYRSRGNDLRASISDLNFWCQIGVGDRRGGFDWFYSRWPKGCDLDEKGDVVRVISEGTYRDGMGWFGRDTVASEGSELEIELESMQQSWDFWQLDVGDWCESTDLGPLASRTWTAATQGGRRLDALQTFDQFYKSQSDADLCSAGLYSTFLQSAIDPSLPSVPSKAKDDFIIGRSLLEADNYSHHIVPHQAISMALKSQSRRQLNVASQNIRQTHDNLGLRPMDEPWVVSKLDCSFRSASKCVTRLDIAHAFDPIAVAAKVQPTAYLDPSVFDRTMQLIILDVAPWVRGIVAFEHQLMQGRLKLNNILSEGGARKRMRNTRSAYSALEGGERKSTRKQRYFGDCLTTGLVMRTGGDDWQYAVAEEVRSSMLVVEAGSSQRTASSQEMDMEESMCE